MTANGIQSLSVDGSFRPQASVADNRIAAASKTRRLTRVSGGRSFRATPLKKNEPPQSTDSTMSNTQSRASIRVSLSASSRPPLRRVDSPSSPSVKTPDFRPPGRIPVRAKMPKKRRWRWLRCRMPHAKPCAIWRGHSWGATAVRSFSPRHRQARMPWRCRRPRRRRGLRVARLAANFRRAPRHRPHPCAEAPR